MPKASPALRSERSADQERSAGPERCVGPEARRTLGGMTTPPSATPPAATPPAPDRRVTIVLVPGFELLDVFGPVQLFSMAPGMAVDFAAPAAGPVASSQGVEVVAPTALADLGELDILLVPGGRGARTLVTDAGFLDVLREVAGHARIVTSVCTGAALLARAGLLDGRRATSNKMSFTWVVEQGPRTTWVPLARWVEDGDRWTSSGVAAGMDMAAALITATVGPEAARTATVRAELEVRTDPDDDPFARVHGLI